MITAHCFRGMDGTRALTMDHSGSNLPQQFEPWKRFKLFELRQGRAEHAKAIATIAREGYYLMEYKNRCKQ